MPHPDHVFLTDILVAAKHVQNFTQGLTGDDLASDVKLRSAVIYQLLLMGEATKQVSEQFRAAHPTIPWTAMAGMRDVLIHKYWGTDPKLVWNAVSESIPSLIAQIEPLIPPTPSAG
jgi:uncharacterized protein with HEPN domain